MGVAAPRAPIGGWGPGPPQKFGQLLSRNQVSQKNQGEPPPPPLKLLNITYLILYNPPDLNMQLLIGRTFGASRVTCASRVLHVTPEEP